MKKESFSSGWGFVLAAAGSAVGLGNIWRFPYLVGQYGGLSFILVYLFVIVFICNPLMVAEIGLGRTSKSNFVDAYHVVGDRIGAKNLSVWSFFGGWVAALCIWMIISFYFVVAGWVLYYFLEALSGDLLQSETRILEENFKTLSTNFTVQYCSGLVFLLLTAFVTLGGVRKGVEKASLLLMPVLFLLLIVMVVQSFLWDSAGTGIKFLLTPDWTAFGISEQGFDVLLFCKVVMIALGQAFMSLSLGYGVLLVYGSYLDNKENLFQKVKQIEFFDTSAAVLSVFAVMPAIFAAGIAPTAGPQLTFISLPIVFGQMPYGNTGAIVFFLLLVLATLTSTISIFEAMTNLLMQKFKTERFGAMCLTLLSIITGFTLVTLSFSGVVELKPWGKDLFTLFDWISTTYLAAVVSLTVALFVGYKCMKQIIKNIAKSATVSERFVRYFLVMLRYVVPLFMGVLLVLAVLNDL